MQQRLSYLTLGVNNLQTMTRFYRDVFGWQPRQDSNQSVTFFQLNGIILALWGREELAADANVNAAGSGFKALSLSHNLRSDQEVDELFAELVARGATPARHPHKTFWGGYSSYLSDPEGNLWEIAHNPFVPLDEQGNIAG